MSTRAEVVTIARLWLGTPYRHQASVKGIGCDCLGMLRGVFREVEGLPADPEETPPYRRDWYERTSRDMLLEAAARHMLELPRDTYGVGDALVFRMKPWASAKHCGILTGEDTMIHSYDGHGVVEVSMGTAWKSKIVATFRFPSLEA